MKTKISRRQFLRTGIAAGSGAFALGFLGCSRLMTGSIIDSTINRYGDLLPDAAGILDLPSGFTYQAISKAGEQMDDQFLVPGAHDGMATFPGPNGKTIIVRNHELQVDAKKGSPFGSKNERLGNISEQYLYDSGQQTKPALGGTTTLVYNTHTGMLEKQYLSLVGTMRNCAGGPTPWNTWISCEESVKKAGDSLKKTGGVFEKDHGYNFEVPASATGGLVMPVPLKAMGRFNHEAVAVDARTGIVYQTEDRNDGLIYRFIPDRPGDLAKGGRLQAMKIRGMKSVDTTNWRSFTEQIFRWRYEETISVGEALEVAWLDIENVESPKDDLRHQGFDKGAARFARGEGMWYSGNAIYFACTNGGENRTGQIWRYIPSPFEGTRAEENLPGQLELFIEPNNSNLLENADNLTVAPWGDLILCEDGSDMQFYSGCDPGRRTLQICQKTH